jgi:hypothetical protein
VSTTHYSQPSVLKFGGRDCGESVSKEFYHKLEKVNGLK